MFVLIDNANELDSISGSVASSFILIGKNVRYKCLVAMVCQVGLRFKQVGRKCEKSKN